MDSQSLHTSPEFEFRNPSSLPPPNLASADQLFLDGILLPLQSLHLSNQTPAADPPVPQLPRDLSDSAAPSSASRRWANLFKKATPALSQQEKQKFDKKKERKTCQTSPELNINLWPFSRSRSAGNGGTRTRPSMIPGTRKANSAPCSRSNSAGSRKWPTSPARVHLARTSPVWQVRRGVESRISATSKKESRRIKTAAATSEVGNLKGPTCGGYRQHLSCRSDENGGGNVESVATLFSLRSLFNKKVF